MTNHTYKIIVNPIAGHGAASSKQPVIKEFFRNAGLSFELEETREPLHAVELARQAVQDGFTVVVAVGGDGTVNEVITGMVAANPSGHGKASGTLGVIPVGTGNDFAAGLKMPLHDVEAACQVLLRGDSNEIDLGRVADEQDHTWLFQNHLGAGLVAAAAIESARFVHLSGMWKYLAGLVRTIPRYSTGIRVTSSCDSIVRDQRVLLIGVSNGPRTAGAFLIAPQASMNDGSFDVVIASTPNMLITFWLIPHFLRGSHVKQEKYVSCFRTASLLLESPEGIPIHLDGQVVRTDARRLEIKVLPSALMVLQPPQSP